MNILQSQDGKVSIAMSYLEVAELIHQGVFSSKGSCILLSNFVVPEVRTSKGIYRAISPGGTYPRDYEEVVSFRVPGRPYSYTFVFKKAEALPGSECETEITELIWHLEKALQAVRKERRNS